MKIFQYIRFFFTLVQLLSTVSVVIILMFIFPKHIRKIRQGWGKLQLFVMGIKLDIHGTLGKNIDLVLLNHQSILDVIIFEAIYPHDLVWVAKKEIANVPFFGNVLKLPKMIIVDRENKAGLSKLQKKRKLKNSLKKDLLLFFQKELEVMVINY